VFNLDRLLVVSSGELKSWLESISLLFYGFECSLALLLWGRVIKTLGLFILTTLGHEFLIIC